MASLYQCQCIAEVCDHMYVWWCVPPLSCPTHVQEVQGFQSTAQVERLLLEHGERVVDRLGAEIDRIEIKICNLQLSQTALVRCHVTTPHTCKVMCPLHTHERSCDPSTHMGGNVTPPHTQEVM